MKRNTIILIYMLFAFMNNSIAQTKLPYPVIGDTLENHHFYDLDNYPTKTANLNDFRGKWLILDMWGYSCTACLNSFPRMNKLAQDFKDKVQVIMVGATKGRFNQSVEKTDRITKNIYVRLKKAYNLKMTVAFDSIFYLKHDVGSLPQIFVIDPNGIIKAKTQHLDSIELASIILGKQPELLYANSYSEIPVWASYKKELPFLTNGKEANGGVDTSFLYRSLLAPGNINLVTYPIDLFRKQKISNVNSFIVNGKIEAFNYDLKTLYKLAYFGMCFWEVNNERAYHNYSQDIAEEVKDVNYLNNLLNKTFTYSLSVPKGKYGATALMQMMQADLHRFFGYSVNVENRNTPVLNLEIVNLDKVKKFLSYKVKEDDTEKNFILEDSNMDRFAFILEAKVFKDIPIINKTGLEGNFNIMFDGNRFDKNDVEKRLIDYGFKLVKGERKMDVITFRDKEVSK